MINIDVCKAQPLGGSEGIDDVIIGINRKIPPKLTLDEWEALCEKQADMINNALSDTLPQGIYDRLRIMFMQNKVSLYQGRTESAF